MPTRVQLRRDVGRVEPSHGPWIRTRQVARIVGVPDAREPVAVEDRHGEVLGWGLVSERSSIMVRMLQWGPQPPPPRWLSQRLTRAFEARLHMGLGAQPTTGVRMVNSEGDGLPGLVVDR